MTSRRQTDMAVERAIEWGRQNAEIVKLVERHCAHARVETVGGVGLVEEQTGLPVGARAVRCQHAEARGFAGANFEPIAVAFFKDNCIGCPHHKPVAGPPNLTSHVAALDETEARQRESEERERQGRTEVHERRAAQRRLAAQGEPYPTRALVHKLDLIDAEHADSAVARQIVETARGVPELFTPRAVEIVFDTARVTGSPRLVEALRWLAHRDRVPADQVVKLAVEILSTTTMAEAAHVLLDYQRALTAADVAPAHGSLIRLAGRGGRYSSAEPAPMLMAAELDLPGCLEAVHEMLESDRDYFRGLAASAAEWLFDEHPEVIPVLGRAVALALRHPGAIDRMGSDERSSAAIEQTLSATLIISPTAARDAIESAARELDEDARMELFSAYDAVLRSRLGKPVPAETGEIVVRVCLQRMSGDWGAEVVGRASRTLELCGKYHPYLLVKHVDALVGVLLREVGNPVATYHPLLDLSPRPNPLKALQVDAEQRKRGGRMRDLREALGCAVRVAPEKVGEHIFALLDAPDVDVDEVQETRALAVRLLGPIGQHPELIARTLPYLYTAVLSSDNWCRAQAIEAWEELAKPRDRQLPAELTALIQTLLKDPYVIVHKAMIRALREGLPVPSEQALDVALILVQLADHYSGEEDFGETAYTALEAARRLGRQLGGRAHEMVIECVLIVAAKVHPSKLTYLLRHLMDELVNRPRYADRLLDVLSCDDHLSREDDLINDLVHVPAAQIAERAARVEEAAAKDLPENPWRVHRYVEVLQLAGEWDAATRLAARAEQSIPNTTENTAVRLRLATIRAGADFEAALARSETAEADALATRWTAAVTAWEQAEDDLDPLSAFKRLTL